MSDERSAQPIELRDNIAEGQFETTVEGRIAYVQYARDGTRLALNHTEVPIELEGRGVASRLVKAVLDKARADGVKVLPYCPFVRTYLKRHPEYRDLIASEMLAE
jgi:predicted GNAT family acetyltransferase